MKSKLTKYALIFTGVVVCCTAGRWYTNFHSSHAWISLSPANTSWAVDLVPSGFVDLGHDFRVHDLAVSPFRPLYICDLYWEDRHWPHELHWSQDGSVVAVAVGFKGHTGKFYGCAYDFLRHQPLRTGSFGSPLELLPEFTGSVELLLASRGGVGTKVPVPDITKP